MKRLLIKLFGGIRTTATTVNFVNYGDDHILVCEYRAGSKKYIGFLSTGWDMVHVAFSSSPMPVFKKNIKRFLNFL